MGRWQNGWDSIKIGYAWLLTFLFYYKTCIGTLSVNNTLNCSLQEDLPEDKQIFKRWECQKEGLRYKGEKIDSSIHYA